LEISDLSYKPEHSAAFRSWLEKPLGRRFVESESHKINSMLPTLFGYQAVILGESKFAACLEQSPIKKRSLINPFVDSKQSTLSSICCRQDKIAVLSESIDLVYIAHCLEFTSNPHEVLREAYRILRPDGHLVVSLFNPLSSWGLWRLFAKYSGHSPWVANFMSLVKLKDWLALLGFDIMRVNHFGYYLPINKANYTSELSAVERYGQKLEFPCGAAYVVEASKRVIPLCPIRPIWSVTPEIIASDLAEPTA
jgi:SAM-dependent methyltransferase